MTLHNAKGLEFPVCIISGMEESLLPHANSFNSSEDIEEERRLCYVGITRAKEELYLTSAMERLVYGRWQNNQPSRFLREIPDVLIEVVNY
jgi:DNA helicase-2/ATP-dependent DNA helicase PcrA